MHLESAEHVQQKHYLFPSYPNQLGIPSYSPRGHFLCKFMSLQSPVSLLMIYSVMGLFWALQSPFFCFVPVKPATATLGPVFPNFRMQKNLVQNEDSCHHPWRAWCLGAARTLLRAIFLIFINLLLGSMRQQSCSPSLRPDLPRQLALT